MRKFFLGSLLVFSHLVYSDSLPLTDWYALVGGASSVRAINTSTNSEDFFYSVPNSQGIAITPDRTLAYITSRDDDRVYVFDLTTNSLTQIISVSGGPFAIALTPDGSAAYVTCIDDTKVVTFPVPANLPVLTISDPIFFESRGIAITPDGSKAYVVNYQSNSVVTFPIPANAPLTIQLGDVDHAIDRPIAVAITPNGSTAYVVNNGNDSILPINVSNDALGDPFIVGSEPYDIAITSNGTMAYVVNDNGGSITPFAIPSNIPASPIAIELNSFPEGIAITPDGKTAYVTLNEGTFPIAAIDLSSHAVTPVPSSLSSPFPVSITPDQAPVAAFNASLTGSPTTFDASASTTDVGTIVSYAWDFGDGTTETVSTPITTHAYSSAGSFLVTLQVTNSAGTSLERTFTGQTVSNNGGPSAQVIHTVSSMANPPNNPIGKQKYNRFLTQTDIVNVITWQSAVGSPEPVSYRIYRNSDLSDLAGTVLAADTLRFEDHNRKKNVAYTYYIVSVDALGGQSLSASTTVAPQGD